MVPLLFSLPCVSTKNTTPNPKYINIKIIALYRCFMAFTKCDCLGLREAGNNLDRRLLVKNKGGETPRQPDKSGATRTQRPAHGGMESHLEKH